MSEIISFFLVIIETFTFPITVNFLKLVSLAFLEELKKRRKKESFHKGKKNVPDPQMQESSWDVTDINFLLSHLHLCFLGSSFNIVAPGNQIQGILIYKASWKQGIRRDCGVHKGLRMKEATPKVSWLSRL